MANTNTTTPTGLLGDLNLSDKFTDKLGKPLSGSAATKLGLGAAYSAISNMPTYDYPAFTPSQTYAPTSNVSYAAYVPNQPMASITAPDYTYNAKAPTYQGGQYNYQNSARTAAPTVSNVGTAPTGTWNTVAAPTLQQASAAPTWQNANLSSQSIANPYSSQTVGNLSGGYQTYGQNANLTNNANLSADYQKLGTTPQFGTSTVNTYGQDAPTYQKLDANALNSGAAAYQKYAGETPTYRGLMGGDYEALQKALTTPGEIAAARAYEQAQKDITEQMGGRGLYGSSIMQQQALTKAQQPYMDTLATNAANAVAQRYGLQAEDLAGQNTFNTNIFNQRMGENQAANTQGYNTWNTVAGLLGAENQAANNQAYNAWNTRVGENLTAGQANQDFQSQLNALLNQVYTQQMSENQAANTQGFNVAKANQEAAGLLNTQNLEAWRQRMAENEAANAQGLDIAKTNQATQLAGAGLNLEAQRANQGAYGDLQSLLAAQNLAKNEQAGSNWQALLNYGQNQNGLMTDIYKTQMGQEQARNAQGLSAYQAQTAANQNADQLRADLYQTGLSDIQAQDAANMQWQNFLANQNQNANQFNLSAAEMAMNQEAQKNANALASSNLMATQNQNLYNAGLTDSQRLQEYGMGQMADTRASEKAYTDWQNQKALEQFQYQLAQQATGKSDYESMLNMLLALAGKGAPLATQAAQSKALTDSAAATATGAGYGGLLSALGDIGAAYVSKT